jgi:hypothetical protein
VKVSKSKAFVVENGRWCASHLFEHARLGATYQESLPSRTLSVRDVGQLSSPAGGSGFQPRVGLDWFIRRSSGKDARRTSRLEACPTKCPTKTPVLGHHFFNEVKPGKSLALPPKKLGCARKKPNPKRLTFW